MPRRFFGAALAWAAAMTVCFPSFPGELFASQADRTMVFRDVTSYTLKGFPDRLFPHLNGTAVDFRLSSAESPPDNVGGLATHRCDNYVADSLPRLRLTLVNERPLPIRWNPTRIIHAGEAGFLVVGQEGQLIHLDDDFGIVVEIPLEGIGQPISARFIGGEEYEVVTSDGLFQVSTTEQFHRIEVPWNGTMVVDADHHSDVGWVVLLSDSTTGRQRMGIESASRGPVEVALPSSPTALPLPYHQIRASGRVLSVTSLNSQAPVLLVSLMNDDGPPSITAIDSGALEEQSSWAGLPLFSLESGFVRMLSDLGSDRRRVVIYDSNGIISQSHDLDVPIAIISTDPSQRHLYMYQRFPEPAVIKYRWCWSRGLGESNSQSRSH